MTKPIQLIFVGNKIDRDDREIPTQVGEEFAERHNMYFLETSAKESDNVERLFMQIAEDLMKVTTQIIIVTPVLVNPLQQARMTNTPRYDPNSYNAQAQTSESGCCSRLN